jgi:hypothetical protein
VEQRQWEWEREAQGFKREAEISRFELQKAGEEQMRVE